MPLRFSRKIILSAALIASVSCMPPSADGTPPTFQDRLRYLKNRTYDALGMDDYVTETCNCVTNEEFRKMKREMAQMIDDFPVFRNPEEEKEILDWQMNEWRNFGNEYHWHSQKYTPYRNAVVLQRSARRRLYDHNIILANIFKGKIIHNTRGDLAPVFKDALFFDIGSAILMDEGAPTVRDIYEDTEVEPHLIQIIASDINTDGAEYIKTYKMTRQNLPFPVHEIPIRLDQVTQLQSVTDQYTKGNTPIIFRSSNSGPDLYYPPVDVRKHFRAVIRAYYDRDVLYFFNKFVLYKPAREMAFEKIGRDSGTGMDHRGAPWELIDWSSRRLQSSFLPNPDYITIKYK